MPEFHPPTEEYLKAIYLLAEEHVDVTQIRLVERLGHAAPTVSQTVRRLRNEGQIVVRGRSIHLTDTGRQRAVAVVRKHHLAERLLTDVIGLAWEKAHVEAGRWEHVISDDVEARLTGLLGSPTTCPHGNRIPGSAGNPSPAVTLSEIGTGTAVRFERIFESLERDPATLTWLAENRIRPGGEATVTGRAPDGTLSLQVGAPAATVSLGTSFTTRIAVSLM